MNIAVPNSKEHDAPEHLRLTLDGGRQFNKYDSARGGLHNADGKDDEIERLYRMGMKYAAIEQLLHVGDRRISNVVRAMKDYEPTKEN